jgi:hypothetical protein
MAEIEAGLARVEAMNADTRAKLAEAARLRAIRARRQASPPLSDKAVIFGMCVLVFIAFAVVGSLSGAH